MLGEAMADVAPEEHQAAKDLHRYGNSWINRREPWLHAASIAFTNVFNFRPAENSIPTLCGPKAQMPQDYSWPPLAGAGKYLRPQYFSEIERLQQELTVCRPNLVVPLGATACWALLQSSAIGSLRGTPVSIQQPTELQGLKALPTYHPASVLYQWSQRPIVVADLMKIRREMAFAEIRRPSREIIYSPSLGEWQQWVRETLARPPSLLACDTETSLGMIDTIGFARARSDGIVCQVGPHRVRRGANYVTTWPQRDGQRKTSYWEPWEEPIFWQGVKDLLESGIPKVFQNGVYDLQYLLRLGLRPQSCQEDTMLLHHSLFPELPKGLGFLGSIYTDEPAWKLMRRGLADTTKRDE